MVCTKPSGVPLIITKIVNNVILVQYFFLCQIKKSVCALVLVFHNGSQVTPVELLSSGTRIFSHMSINCDSNTVPASRAMTLTFSACATLL